MSQEIVNSSDSEAVPDSAESRVLKGQDLGLVKSSEESQQTDLPKAQRKFAWWMLPVLGLVLAVGGLSVYRLQSKNSEVATVAERAPLSVRTVAAEEGDIQAWVSSEGTVQAVRFKHLAFDVDGDITYLANKDGRSLRAGDLVQQGELLAQIDPWPRYV